MEVVEEDDHQGLIMVENARPNVWQLQSRRDLQGLVIALYFPDPEVRKRAAVALRMINASQAVPALKMALKNEPDDLVRKNIIAALHVLDHQTDVLSLVKGRDVHGLIASLKSRHPENVIIAVKALGELGDRLAVEPLIILFHNASSPARVRLAAAEALLQLKSAPAVVTLLGALRRDSWEVRRNAAAVLGQIQATWAVDPLAEALHDPHPVVRRTAAAALRRIGTGEALAALRAHLTPQPAAQPVQPAQADDVSFSDLPAPLPVISPTRQSKPALTPAPPPVSMPVVPDRLSVTPSPIKAETQPTRPDPLPAMTAAPEPESETTPALQPERPGSITYPVKKLIAFLRQRGP
ncbi:MAG: HEAT repeat domain-containing protein [Chloroflexi bacterium]|nr:HEAT repeat domain-containing protein [Chloroflexota bacterium]